jgi:hypothetical protein
MVQKYYVTEYKQDNRIASRQQDSLQQQLMWKNMTVPLSWWMSCLQKYCLKELTV